VLKGLGDLGKMGGMLKQAMEMKGKMEELKEQLGDERVEAASGGGMVQIVMNGRMELLSIKIEPDIINPEESEMLETLVQAAINEGTRKAQDMVKEKMSEVAGDMDIPGLTS
jgi:nucleoid-associated protein EbfC